MITRTTTPRQWPRAYAEAVRVMKLVTGIDGDKLTKEHIVVMKKCLPIIEAGK